MKLAFLATIYLFSLTLAVAPQDDHTPVPQHSDWSHYRAIARLPRGITIPTTAPASGTPLPHDDAPAETPEDIDARQQWPWEKEPHVIGVYPDGRPKCRIMSMTA
ncbi:hypothetical protein BU26DRAFT_553180 [Trematosphaeria pertusa]|uniref:Lytic polysaccharide monooxygenase n=1 Tax=Trematosphaeria pertusa TaxID=390896 RepID=A0A6A6I6U4_9PLEO|nr:uncharacterized protein BU26DRAFT_553180 [Trematosphaeria pertusa]KAF2246274.1 hypothetical protein BU26DRAFT_553180 [Trematosphaeria pertusa]